MEPGFQNKLKDPPLNINKAIQTCRCQHGFSQKELGKAIYSDASQIRQLEDGTRTPGLKVIQKICIALDISIFELLYTAQEPLDLHKLPTELVDIMNKLYEENTDE